VKKGNHGYRRRREELEIVCNNISMIYSLSFSDKILICLREKQLEECPEMFKNSSIIETRKFLLFFSKMYDFNII